jgi:hypothetical protein
MGVPSGRVIFAQHMPWLPSALDGRPDTLMSVPGFRVSGVHPVRVNPPAAPSSICHSTFLPFSSASKYRNECGFLNRNFVTVPCASTVFVES